TKDGKIGRVGARLLSTTSPDGAPNKPAGMTTPDYYTTTYTTTDYTNQLASSLAPLLKNRADFVVEKILSTAKNKFPGDSTAQKIFTTKISQKLESLKQTKPKRETILNYIITQIK
ncbi:MAG TPA: hypothetical protein PKC14_04545, partial [Candidatus Absconditabacterales bacterium]|nr:hypothetical protein [Candidatus Absconditabacterales bacterium]